MQHALEFYADCDARSYYTWDQSAGHSQILPALLINTVFQNESFRHLRKGATIADLGCGPGTSLGRLAALLSPKKCIAVDGAQSMLSFASTMLAGKSYEFHTQCKDIGSDALDIESSSVDLIVCSNVLGFIKNIARVFSEASRILSTGGVWTFNFAGYDIVQRRTLTGDDDEVFVYSHSLPYVQSLLAKHALAVLVAREDENGFHPTLPIVLTQYSFVVQKL